MKINRLWYFFLIFLIPAISSCGDREPYEAKLSRIRVGMTTQSVLRVLGKPKYVVKESHGTNGMRELWRYPGFSKKDIDVNTGITSVRTGPRVPQKIMYEAALEDKRLTSMPYEFTITRGRVSGIRQISPELFQPRLDDEEIDELLKEKIYTERPRWSEQR